MNKGLDPRSQKILSHLLQGVLKLNNEWWKPENLAESELKHRTSDSIDNKNDFGSYKLMLNSGDVEKSLIRSHNELQPQYRANFIKNLVDLTKVCSVLDVGCGLGYTTKSLKDVFVDAEVTGVDISADAISYAKSKFASCKFICQAIDPKSNGFNERFDLICAIEFYPFTRTSDFLSHVSFIEYLLSLLKPDGRLIIWQKWDNPESLSSNYAEVKLKFNNHDFYLSEVPMAKIARIFPKSFHVSLLLTKVARVIFQRILNKPIGSGRCVVISGKQ